MKFYVLRLVDWLPSAEIITSRTPSAEIITSRTLLSGDNNFTDAGYYENSNISGMTFKINKSQGITWNAIFLKNSPCDCVQLVLICTTKTSASSGNFSERIHALGRLLQKTFF
jgi:hypothetical protein